MFGPQKHLARLHDKTQWGQSNLRTRRDHKRFLTDLGRPGNLDVKPYPAVILYFQAAVASHRGLPQAGFRLEGPQMF